MFPLSTIIKVRKRKKIQILTLSRKDRERVLSFLQNLAKEQKLTPAINDIDKRIKLITSESQFVKDQYEKIKDLENEKEESEIKKLADINIYHLNTRWHKIGWMAFFVILPCSIYYFKKQKSKKTKISNNFEDIKDKFISWRLNIYGSLVFYILFFVLTGQAVDRWFRPSVKWLLRYKLKTTFALTSTFLGILFILDSVIASSLKTPLQRLTTKIEYSKLKEKDKRFLLSKTQEGNETFKEDFKKFGVIAIPNIIVGIFGSKVWNREVVAYICYLIPVFYASFRIWEIDTKIKKLEKCPEINFLL